jgi:Ca2+-binding RTX toxin-like protein
MALASESVTVANSGLVFVNSYDATVSAAYKSAIVTAENYLQSHFTDSITINASFSLASLGAGAAAENNFSTIHVSYGSLVGALRSHATTADDQLAVNGLPTSDPSNGAGFSLAQPEAILLGLAHPTTANEIHVTLNSDLAWTFGQDAVGAIEHELTEGGFGRIGSLGYAQSDWGVMDLFRFTGGGVRDYTGGADGITTYFGLDSSHVLGPIYHNSVDATGAFDGADLADWNQTRGDAFGPGGPNAPGSITATDLRVLDILGWTPTGSASAGQILTASQASPTLTGGAGADTLTGWSGDASMSGGDGNDLIQGGAGWDYVNGNKGDDVIDGGSGGADWLVGGQGNDLITAHTSGNILYGNLGSDTLNGGTGDELIRGGQGDDVLSGGAGRDWMSGDRGSDTLTGGTGADTFHASSGEGLDVVTDFSIADGDHVQLDAGMTYTASQSGADVVINLGGSDEMVLKNVTLATLPSNWIFTL